MKIWNKKAIPARRPGWRPWEGLALGRQESAHPLGEAEGAAASFLALQTWSTRSARSANLKKHSF